MRKNIIKKLQFLFFLLIITNLTCIYAQTNIIKIGYQPNYGVINTPVVRGSEGFGFEYFLKIEEYTDYKFEYIPLSWNDGLELLKNGEIDLLGPAAMTEERKETYEFIETPFGEESLNLYSSINADFKYKNLTELNKLTIGMVEGTAYLEEIEDYKEKYNLDLSIKYIDCDKVHEYFKNNEIDLYLEGSLFKIDSVKLIDARSREEFYFMATKGQKDLCNTINNAMAEIRAENPYFKEILWNKYYGDTPRASKEITQQELLVLEEKNNYTVGYHVDLAPLSYKNDNNLPSGYAIDIMNILAKKMDITITYVPLHDKTNDIPSENLDFNLCPIDDDCVKHGYISTPYDVQDIMLLTRSDITQQKDVKEILFLDYAAINLEEFLEPYINANIHPVKNEKEAFKIEDEYNIDCRIASSVRSQMIVNSNSKEKYNINLLGIDLPVGIIVSSNLPEEIRSALNKTIKSLTDYEIKEIILASTSSLKEKITLSKFLQLYWRGIVSILVFFSFSFLFFYLRAVIKNSKKLRNLVEFNQLTGLLSFEKTKQEIEKKLKIASPSEYYIITFDIDNMKHINQVYGYKKGNEVLCAIADNIRQRASKDSLLCHIQDDVFLIFGNDNKIFKLGTDNPLFGEISLEEERNTLGIQIPFHTSTGIYFIDDPTENIDYMLTCVRKARKISKKTHGTTTTIYSKELRLQAEKETEIYISMENAIKAKEFFIVIQPKIELKTKKLVGGEVLVRWKKKDGTFFYPDEFIPLFEKNNFIATLDKYVFNEACNFISSSEVQIPCLSINVSVVTVLKTNFIEQYMSILNSYNLSPKQFEIEITESALAKDSNAITKIADTLQNLGFKISVDDFGKGESSLTRIKELNVDVIKLDKEFLGKNMEDKKGIAVISNIISLGNSLELLTLAEGIETKKELDLLINLNCDLGQGYYFDKPLMIDDFLRKVKEYEEYVNN